MSLHLHRRTPLVRIPHQHTNGGTADARVTELVPAPGIGGEHALQSRTRPDDGIRETACRRSEHRRSAAAMPLRADPRCIDLGKAGQDFPRGQHVVRTGGKGKLRLIGDGRSDAARAKTVEHERCKAGAGERFGMRNMRRRHAEAAGHDHHQRQFCRGRAPRQKQFAVDRHRRHRRGLADDLVIVGRRGRRDVDIPRGGDLPRRRSPDRGIASNCRPLVVGS